MDPRPRRCPYFLDLNPTPYRLVVQAAVLPCDLPACRTLKVHGVEHCPAWPHIRRRQREFFVGESRKGQRTYSAF